MRLSKFGGAGVRGPDRDPGSKPGTQEPERGEKREFLLRQAMVTLDRLRLAVHEMAGRAVAAGALVEDVMRLQVILDECDRAIAASLDISEVKRSGFLGEPQAGRAHPPRDGPGREGGLRTLHVKK